jgi:hypothetical protein
MPATKLRSSLILSKAKARRYAQLLQRPEQRQALLDIGQEDGFGDLDFQPLRLQAAVAERRDDGCQQRVVAELTDREIDGDL